MISLAKPLLMHILGISGSLRSGSFNTKTLKAAQSLVPEGVELSVYVPHDIPLYNFDVQEQGFPEPVRNLEQQIQKADAVLIATPEYNYSVSGILKNTIDWLSRVDSKPFNRMPLAILGASTGRLGTARAQYHLRQIFVALDADVLNKPEVMISGARKAFTDDGNFADETTEGFVEKQIQALVDLAKLRKARR